QITPSLVVVARPFDHQAFLKSKEKGIKCLSMKDWRWKRPDIKTTNLLPAVLSKQEACDQGFDDVIWFDDDGFVTEATASNVWIIKNGILITRPASGAILGGITRLRLIELAKNLGYEVKEECFTLKDIYDSEEAFLSSSNICALPINSVDRNTLKNAPNFNHVLGLQRAYEEFCAYLNV
ncbi:MAG TPA: aminotransferase class IV, partial [Alphaproteobacteria bacterium]|nr:aminotransferase class IV [Alphaproteobacteria bacterium]